MEGEKLSVAPQDRLLFSLSVVNLYSFNFRMLQLLLILLFCKTIIHPISEREHYFLLNSLEFVKYLH